MGQYWKPVNLDKHEFIDPHRLGSGLKLWEQLANHPGTNAALIVLLAAMPEPRGGGDFDLDTNWHGPERVDMGGPGPMPEAYPAIAARTIGRWAGDRIALVGDYAEDGDLAPEHEASKIYGRCQAETEEVVNDDPDGAAYSIGYGENVGKYVHYVETAPPAFKDITDDVVKVIEHELRGRYQGEGWRHWVEFCPSHPDKMVGHRDGEAPMTDDELDLNLRYGLAPELLGITKSEAKARNNGWGQR